MSFNNPKAHTTSFQMVRGRCNKRNLHLYLAENPKLYKALGGNFAVYCRRTGQKVFAADTLQEIADHLQIGGVYD